MAGRVTDSKQGYRARLQIRAVIIVYRYERDRAARGSSFIDLGTLRVRSLDRLDELQADLESASALTAELEAELASARAELEV